MKSLYFITFCFVSTLSYGLTTYPQGVYLDANALQTKNPTSASFRVKEFSALIFDKYTNNFKVESDVGKKVVRKEWLAVSDGKSLYLNCGKLGYDDGFSKVLVEGHFLVFKGGISTNVSTRAPTFNPNFPNRGSENAKGYIGYYTFVYDSDRGASWILNEENFRNLMSINQSILTSLSNNSVMDEDNMHHYISDLNDSIDYGLVDSNMLFGNTLLKYPFHVVVYRNAKGEGRSMISYSINDSVELGIEPNSYTPTMLSSRDSNEICLKKPPNSCIAVHGREGKNSYIKVSKHPKPERATIELVSKDEAEWDGRKIQPECQAELVW